MKISLVMITVCTSCLIQCVPVKPNHKIIEMLKNADQLKLSEYQGIEELQYIKKIIIRRKKYSDKKKEKK